MKNFEIGNGLIQRAWECLDEAGRALERKAWNMTIRRAQEAVELGLKGILKIVGFEYPKVHDIGRFFSEALAKRGIQVEGAILERIEDISSELASRRSPAFYMETIYTEDEAKKAEADARWIIKVIDKLKMELGKGK